MSRTFRRKHVPRHTIIDTMCYVHYSHCVNCEFVTCTKQCSFRDSSTTVSLYRRDTKRGYGWNGAAPKDFRKMLDRSKKAKNKAMMRKVLREGVYDDAYTFIPFKRDAGWYYW